MRNRTLLAALLSTALALPAQAQVIIGGGGTGGSGTGNATFGTATGNTADHAVTMSNTTTGIKDAGFAPAPASQVTAVTGSNPTITATTWGVWVQYDITGSGRTLTFPATSTLSTNSGAQINTLAASVTVAANAADTITFNGSTTSTGGSVTLPMGGFYTVTTDGAGNLRISGRSVQGNGTKVQLSTGSTTTDNCVKFDANGNTVDAGAACGSGGSPVAQNAYFAGSWYWLVPLGVQISGSATNPGSNVATFLPFTVSQTITVASLAVHVGTVFSGGKCQVAIYGNSSSWSGPGGAVLMSSGDISTTTGGPFSASVTGSPQLTPGVYWEGVNCDNTTVSLKGLTNNNGSQNVIAGASSLATLSTNGTATGSKWTVAMTYGTWSTISAAPTIAAAGGNVPIAAMSIASVP